MTGSRVPRAFGWQRSPGGSCRELQTGGKPDVIAKRGADGNCKSVGCKIGEGIAKSALVYWLVGVVVGGVGSVVGLQLKDGQLRLPRMHGIVAKRRTGASRSTQTGAQRKRGAFVVIPYCISHATEQRGGQNKKWGSCAPTQLLSSHPAHSSRVSKIQQGDEQNQK